MTTIRMAMIGLGKMGNHMLEQAGRNDLGASIEIVAACDTDEAGLRAFADSYPGASIYTNYKALLDECQIDLLYVAVPPKVHYPVVMEALQRKIPVFCEKPLANSAQEAADMLAAAEGAGVMHAVHFSMPHEPAVLKLQQLLDQRTIGSVRKIELILQFPQWPRSWQQNEWITGREQGGFILEVGIHWIHVIQNVFGSITVLRSEVDYPEDALGCEREVYADMRLDDGTRVELKGISHFSGEERVSMIVYGTEGTLALENWEELMGGAIGQPLMPIETPESMSELPVLKHVIARLQGKPGRIYDFNDGYRAQLVLEALRSPKLS